mmetsp:Transcript_47335/g.135729  ORF Transcript_47335/g.135729 Transcript_47335/m.135729 type:complete len:905 (+) Transcript_47335:31-2745(+)
MKSPVSSSASSASTMEHGLGAPGSDNDNSPVTRAVSSPEQGSSARAGPTQEGSRLLVELRNHADASRVSAQTGKAPPVALDARRSVLRNPVAHPGPVGRFNLPSRRSTDMLGPYHCKGDEHSERPSLKRGPPSGLSGLGQVQRSDSSEIRELLEDTAKFARDRLGPRQMARQGRDWMLGTSYGHFVALLSLGLLLIALGTSFWHLAGGNEDYSNSLNDSFWMSWCLFIDTGTQTGIPAANPAEVRIVGVVCSLCGYIFNLTLMGLVVEAIRVMLKHFKEMYSRISTTGHVLILGWGDKTLLLLSELLAEEKKEDEALSRCYRWCCRRHRDIVILANRQEVDMRLAVQMHMRSEGLKCYGISYRRGEPTDRTELMKVSAQFADDILIMGSGESVHSSDQQIISTLLALGALPGVSKLHGDVFAEIQTNQSVTVAKTILPAVEGIVARYAVNRVLVLRALVSSIGFTYLELVSFRRGNDLYIKKVPSRLVGVAFRDMWELFEESVVIGVLPLCVGCLRPEITFYGDRELEDGDKLVLLARSMRAASRWARGKLSHIGRNRTSSPLGKALQMAGSGIDAELVQADGQLLLGPQAVGPKVVLMIGCPIDFPNILEALDCYSATGSEVHVLSPKSLEWRRQTLSDYFGSDDMDALWRRIFVRHYVGSPTSLHSLEGLPLAQTTSVIILAEPTTDYEAPLAVDSRNLTTVISLRGLLSKARGSKKVKVVTELMDPKTSQVLERNAGIRQLGSFVYSNAVTTGVFAMAAAEKCVYTVLKDLVDPAGDGGNIVAASMHGFIKDTEELNFLELRSRVWETCGGILLGWRRMSCRYPDLNPRNKEERLIWHRHSSDELLILRPRRLRTFSEDNSPMGGVEKSSSFPDDRALPSSGFLPAQLPDMAITKGSRGWS